MSSSVDDGHPSIKGCKPPLYTYSASLLYDVMAAARPAIPAPTRATAAVVEDDLKASMKDMMNESWGQSVRIVKDEYKESTELP
jgi:hypothetical protein